MADARKKPISPSLYTPQSFANEQVIESTIAQVTKYTDADLEYSQKQKLVRSKFRDKMAQVDPEYLRSWDVERKGQEEAEQSAIDLEREWLDSTVSLYRYGASHLKDMSVENGHLNFAPDALKVDFGNTQDQIKTLYKKWQEAAQGLARTHEQKRAEAGLP